MEGSDRLGEIKVDEHITPLRGPRINTKQFDIGYLPCDCDILTPQSLESIKQAASKCRHLIVGIKNKDDELTESADLSVFDLQEKSILLSSLRNTHKVVESTAEVLPPQEILQQMQDAINMGSRCTVFIGADSGMGTEEMSEQTFNELDELQKQCPGVQLTYLPTIPTAESLQEIKLQGLERLRDTNPYEAVLGEELN